MDGLRLPQDDGDSMAADILGENQIEVKFLHFINFGTAQG